MKKFVLGSLGFVALSFSGAAAAVGPSLSDMIASSGQTTNYKDIRRLDGQCDLAARTMQNPGDKLFALTEIITNSSDGTRAAMTSGCISSVRHYRWLNGELLMTKREFLDTSDQVFSSTTYVPGIQVLRANMAGSFGVWQKMVTTNSSGKFTGNETWLASYFKAAGPTRTEVGNFTSDQCVVGQVSTSDSGYINTFTYCQGAGNVIIQERSLSSTGTIAYSKAWVKF